MKKPAMKLTGLPPIAPDRPRILILGSMPGGESLRQQRYYAHPRNAFWKIMARFLGFDETSLDSLDYAHRTRKLKQHHIALWDVLKHCERQGSLDSAIQPASEEPNDLAGFLRDHDRIKTVLFNGGKAEKSFNRHIRPQLHHSHAANIQFFRLPSSSPANAQLTFEEKYAIWQQALVNPTTP